MLTISYGLMLHCACFRRSCIEHCSADTIYGTITNFFTSSDLRYNWKLSSCWLWTLRALLSDFWLISGQCYRQATKTPTGDKIGYQKDHSHAMVKKYNVYWCNTWAEIYSYSYLGVAVIGLLCFNGLTESAVTFPLLCSIHIGGKLQRGINCSMVENP